MKRVLLALMALTLFSMLTTASVAGELPIITIPKGTTPTIDGVISPGEWTAAGVVTFPTSGGDCTVYFMHDGTALYFAFDVPNADINTPAPEKNSSVQVFIDADHDCAPMPQTDDWRFTISLRTNPLDDDGENQGNGVDWGSWNQPAGWQHAKQVSFVLNRWIAEFRIPFTKVGVEVGDVIGIAFCNAWTNTGDHYWPPPPHPTNYLNPSTWGTGCIDPLVGGIRVPVDKLGLLAPYIGLASIAIVGTVATAVYVKRRNNKK